MDAATFQSAIEQIFLAGWSDDAVNLLTPVALANVRGLLTKVDGSARIKLPPEDAIWSRFGIHEQDTGQVTINDPCEVETIGRITVEIYTPEGQGSRQSRIYGDRVSFIFERTALPQSMIHCSEGRAREIGQVLRSATITDLSTAWWRYDVTIPYWRRRFVPIKVA